MLESKVANTGSQVVKVDRFFPSSRLCPACGLVNTNLTLSDREWTCECGVHHDRDLNAARNILSSALSARTVRCDANVVVLNTSVATEAARL